MSLRKEEAAAQKRSALDIILDAAADMKVEGATWRAVYAKFGDHFATQGALARRVERRYVEKHGCKMPAGKRGRPTKKIDGTMHLIILSVKCYETTAIVATEASMRKCVAKLDKENADFDKGKSDWGK